MPRQIPDKTKVPRYGFILASTHTGSSNALWASIADAAATAGVPLFVFPGGRLESSYEFEYLRNSIYSLANRENLDGLICWGSSLGGTVSIDSVRRYLTRFSDLPMVTIALKLVGRPNIGFDAYQGMRSSVLHCIDVHNAQNIAFIRGPLNHASAEERFQAYLDALTERNIACDANLVSPPFPWNEGTSALRQLVDDRKLLPGRDFDTLVCASDLLMFNAAKVLQKMGYTIPDDIRVVGFNDSPESRFLSSPGTTVRVPFTAMGKHAFSMLQDLIGGKAEVVDHLEPAELIIRNSCGCGRRVHLGSGADDATLKKDDLIYWFSHTLKVPMQKMQAWVDPLVHSLYHITTEASFNSFVDILERVFQRVILEEFDPVLLDRTVEILEHLSDIPVTYRYRIASVVRQTALEVQTRLYDADSYEQLRRAQILNSFKCDLLRAWDRQAIAPIMHTYLPQLGIRQAFLVMAENDEYSRFLGGYSADGDIENGSEVFPSSILLPDRIRNKFAAGVHMVQPLFTENQPLGYLVTTVSDRDGGMHEDLRSSVSSALNGILLFEETIAAKKVAENAEQAKMDFFATMGEGLKEPLVSILSKIQKLEKKSQSNEFSVGLASVRREVEAQLEKTSLLFDYTLAQAGVLEMDYRLLNTSEYCLKLRTMLGVPIETPLRLPLIRADEKRLDQVFSILVGYYKEQIPVSVHVSIHVKGLEIAINYEQMNAIKHHNDNAIRLAQSIVLLHRGDLVQVEHGWRAVFPWLSLGSAAAEHARSNSSIIARLVSKTLPENDELIQFARKNNMNIMQLHADKILSKGDHIDDCGLLLWDADEASFEQYVALKVLSQHRTLFKTPVMCFATQLEGSDLMDALNSKTLSKDTGAVICWGPDPNEFSMLSKTVQLLSVENQVQFFEIAKECQPAVIITDTFDEQTISTVRANEVTSLLPLVVILDRFPPDEVMTQLSAHPHVIACHSGIADCEEFVQRIRDLAHDADILPVHTGALVKRAQKFIETHAAGQLSRWKIADSANVSEDYLTRIFKKELGLSPWEYVNRYRIHLACDLLLHTNLPLSEISIKTGFQDQAYFCRVFKKLQGCTPSELRSV
ncbi:MAG: substrate-binding domain-containing protein [Sphaerochaetaceae bacterium]|nr:substrate-binding domain-containing protein [Sphaerochaetaceae bacterium]MDD4258403.1 substrate-binding domain-containing protein [Sphaerochaetaceae bacterium]